MTADDGLVNEQYDRLMLTYLQPLHKLFML